MIRLLTCLTFTFTLSIVAGLANAEGIELTDPSVNATPPGSTVSAAYFTLHNNGEQELSIIGAHSPEIPRMEIHLTRVIDDVTTMEKQVSVTVSAGQSIQFKPGGFHLMLMGLTESLNAGDTVSVIIETSAGQFPLEMPITMPRAHTGMATHSMQKDTTGMQHDQSTEPATGTEATRDIK